jgi:hypothetical protein
MKTTEIVLEVKLPVRLKELEAVVCALEQIHGKHVLWLRQAGEVLQIYKPSPVSPNPQDLAQG